MAHPARMQDLHHASLPASSMSEEGSTAERASPAVPVSYESMVYRNAVASAAATNANPPAPDPAQLEDGDDGAPQPKRRRARGAGHVNAQASFGFTAPLRAKGHPFSLVDVNGVSMVQCTLCNKVFTNGLRDRHHAQQHVTSKRHQARLAEYQADMASSCRNLEALFQGPVQTTMPAAATAAGTVPALSARELVNGVGPPPSELSSATPCPPLAPSAAAAVSAAAAAASASGTGRRGHHQQQHSQHHNQQHHQQHHAAASSELAMAAGVSAEVRHPEVLHRFLTQVLLEEGLPLRTLQPIRLQHLFGSLLGGNRALGDDVDIANSTQFNLERETDAVLAEVRAATGIALVLRQRQGLLAAIARFLDAHGAVAHRLVALARSPDELLRPDGPLRQLVPALALHAHSGASGDEGGSDAPPPVALGADATAAPGMRAPASSSAPTPTPVTAGVPTAPPPPPPPSAQPVAQSPVQAAGSTASRSGGGSGAGVRLFTVLSDGSADADTVARQVWQSTGSVWLYDLGRAVLDVYACLPALRARALADALDMALAHPRVAALWATATGKPPVRLADTHPLPPAGVISRALMHAPLLRAFAANPVVQNAAPAAAYAMQRALEQGDIAELLAELLAASRLAHIVTEALEPLFGCSLVMPFVHEQLRIIQRRLENLCAKVADDDYASVLCELTLGREAEVRSRAATLLADSLHLVTALLGQRHDPRVSPEAQRAVQVAQAAALWRPHEALKCAADAEALLLPLLGTYIDSRSVLDALLAQLYAVTGHADRYREPPYCSSRVTGRAAYCQAWWAAGAGRGQDVNAWRNLLPSLCTAPPLANVGDAIFVEATGLVLKPASALDTAPLGLDAAATSVLRFNALCRLQESQARSMTWSL